MQHPESLRIKVIERALSGGVTQDALAEEFGVSRSSIQNWLRQYRQSGGQRVAPKEKSPQSWSRSQRLDALLETHGMSEEQRGAWCRQRGVHTHQLEQWRHELIDSDSGSVTGAAETRSLRQENKALKKELRRKEKALAETTALLVLKKKAADIWGETEDD
jgi:transposase